jgi:hypothetical protein
MVFGAVDWWARGLAAAGIAVAFAGIAWNIYTWRHPGHISLKVQSAYRPDDFKHDPADWMLRLAIKNRTAHAVTITDIKRQRRDPTLKRWAAEEDSHLEWRFLKGTKSPFPLEIASGDWHRLYAYDPMVHGTDPQTGKRPHPDSGWVFRVVLDDGARFRSRPAFVSYDRRRGLRQVWARLHRPLPA